MGENSFASIPVAAYGVVNLAAAMAYYVLVRALIRREDSDSVLVEAVGNDRKGKASPLLFAIAIPIALVAPWISFAIYVLVAAIWFVPDPRIERRTGR